MKNETLIFGLHAVHEMLLEGTNIDQILIKKASDHEMIREIIFLARKNGVTVKTVPIEKLNRITKKNHQGVIAFTSPVEFINIENIIPSLYENGRTPLIVILDRVSDVRNFGAIVRSCECFGVDAIIVPQKGAAQISEDAAKTSAGALYKIPICKVKSLSTSVEFLKQSGIKVVSVAEKFEKQTFKTDLTVPTAIILGAEDTGIQPKLIEMSDENMIIPMLGEISSLNVSVAAGISLYEAIKQRALI